MTDENENRPGRAPLTLKPRTGSSVSTGTVKQSFSHGRSKTVVVETKRPRLGTPPAVNLAAPSAHEKRPPAFDVRGPQSRAAQSQPADAHRLSEDERLRRQKVADEFKRQQAERAAATSAPPPPPGPARPRRRPPPVAAPPAEAPQTEVRAEAPAPVAAAPVAEAPAEPAPAPAPRVEAAEPEAPRAEAPRFEAPADRPARAGAATNPHLRSRRRAP